MGKKIIFGIGVVLILIITALFVFGLNKKEPETALTAAPAPVATAPAPRRVVAFTPVIATLAQTDACTDAVMANPQNRLTERKARRIAKGARFTGKNGMQVTVTDSDGIWGACKAALSDPQATQLATTKARKQELAAEVAKMTAESRALTIALNKAQTDLTAINAQITALEREIAARQPHVPATPVVAPAPQSAAPRAPVPPATAQAPVQKN